MTLVPSTRPGAPVDRSLGEERQRVGRERRGDAADVAELAVQVDRRARPRRHRDVLHRRHAALGQEARLHRDRRLVGVQQQVERVEVRWPPRLRRTPTTSAARSRRRWRCRRPTTGRCCRSAASTSRARRRRRSAARDGGAEVLAGELRDGVGVERQPLLRRHGVLLGDHLAGRRSGTSRRRWSRVGSGLKIRKKLSNSSPPREPSAKNQLVARLLVAETPVLPSKFGPQ